MNSLSISDRGRLFLKSFRQAFFILRGRNPLILASSTAFFTTFSLPPIILILVNILSIYFAGDEISKGIILNVQTTMGEQPAEQIRLIVKNFESLHQDIWYTLAGFAFFSFVATTLLLVIQQSIHILWHISIKSKVSWRVNLAERIKALIFILSLGLLFLISQLLDALVSFLYNYAHVFIPELSHYHLRFFNVCASATMITLWITILFKFLPDAKVKWEVALAGGFVTGVLYMFGKFLLNRFLVHGGIATIFGASASFALILLFIFYSSFIVYYGASFTYAYARNIKKPISPGKYADSYIETVIKE